MGPKRKILCICEGGFTRSVCLAGHLRNRDGTPVHDAIAASWRYNTPETIEMLSAWADLVVVMESYMVEKIPFQHRGKLMVCDVGPDRYGKALHPDLVNKVTLWCREQGLRE